MYSRRLKNRSAPFILRGAIAKLPKNIYFYVLQFNSLSSVILPKVNFVNGISPFVLLRNPVVLHGYVIFACRGQSHSIAEFRPPFTSSSGSSPRQKLVKMQLGPAEAEIFMSLLNLRPRIINLASW
jgi:hypothetical protein